MKVTPFAMADKFGVSLADTVLWCRNHGMTIDTRRYVSEARDAGWNDEKIKQSLLHAFDLIDGAALLPFHAAALDAVLSGDMDK